MTEDIFFYLFPKILFALFVLGALLILLYTYRSREERRLAFDRLARELGFTSDDLEIKKTDVLSEPPGSGRGGRVMGDIIISAIRLFGPQLSVARNELKAILSHFRLFRGFSSVRIENLLTKDSRGGKIYLFEGLFRKKSSNRSYYRTAFAVNEEGLDFPECTVVPEKHADRLYRFLGFIGLDHKDINVEFDPEFSSSYVVRGADELRVREILNAGVCRWFMGLKEDYPHFESKGTAFAIFFEGKKLEIDEIKTLFFAASEFLRMWVH
ncbi:MAG: hypothetical protein JW984_08460 [Deltaproteobacteria bacterium]|uniref:DUF3137 domain-containing protein n=1 Tax=Candidatus Zymogenus saltonus TaxID=2844893 RepID=A0A9D8PMB4_9DELT|nr:hypothetical protein [Candidatus Zymogenus saltonus]